MSLSLGRRSARPSLVLIATVVLGTIGSAASAAVLNLREAPYSAAGDGETDDRPALARALADAKSGDTLLIPPGDYRLVLTKQRLQIPAGVTVLGVDGRSRLLLHTDGDAGGHRELFGFASGVTLQGLHIQRDAEFPAVLLPIFGEVDGLTLRDCVIDGAAERFPKRYCHAIQVGFGTLRNFTIRGVTIRACDFGLFQPNHATGRVDGVTVELSHFEQNTASDLEFNSPRGDMRNVVVRRCTFADNRSTAPSAGFAVGLAKVKHARIEDNVIRGYNSEALHVEDHSEGVVLARNTIIGGSTRQPNGVIMILSASKNVTVEHNFIDGRPNENNPHLVLVTAGGDQFSCPTDVRVNANVLIHGPKTRTWYLQPGSGPDPAENVIVKRSADGGGED